MREWLASSRLSASLAFLLALLVLTGQVLHSDLRAPQADEYCYLIITHDLVTEGVFTDGCFKPPGTAEAGRFFAPAYPVLVATLARIDTGLAASITCYAESRGASDGACHRDFASLVVMQIVLASLSCLFIFLTARELSQSELVAWSTLGLVLASGELGYYARSYLTENTALVAFFGFLYALVRAVTTAKTTMAAVAGVALGLAILSRPAFLYLVPLVALFLAIGLAKQTVARAAVVSASIFVAAAMLAVSVWSFRNLMRFGTPSLTEGYGPYSLAVRIAYNDMTWSEWLIAWIYWLPDFGGRLAGALFDRSIYRRLGLHDADGFFQLGNRLHESLRSIPPDQQLSFLLETYIRPHWAEHLLVALPLTLRGMWVGKYLSLVGLPLILPVALWLRREGRLLAFLALVLPCVIMAVLYGLLSVNVTRYNVPLIAVYAFTVAMTAERLARIASARFPALKRQSSNRS